MKNRNMTDEVMEFEKLTEDPEYHKKYYQQNKDVILARVTRKILCECGKSVSYCNIAKHKKTEVHNRVVKLLETTKRV